MKLNTMAAVMSFISKIENDSSSFYENYDEKYPEVKDTFHRWAKENRKFEKMVKQTYFGIITDTIESNYSFDGLDTDDYDLVTTLPVDIDLTEAKKGAHILEETIKNFYLKASQLSEGLMADIPKLFEKIVKKREERLLFLRSSGMP